MKTLVAILLLVVSTGGPAAFADDSAQAPPPARTPEQTANLRRGVIDGLADQHAKRRAAAADMLVAAWPDSASILDEALASTNSFVRIEAVRVLERPELGDVHERLKKAFSDSSESVRRQAVRVARKAKWPDLERHLIELVNLDSSLIVRQEALRALEERGTTKCLRAVLDRMAIEQATDAKSRCKRVLAAILGADHGDDMDAWSAAISEAEHKARVDRAK